MIIDGKKIAEEMLEEVAEEVKKLPKPPRLAAVLVEDGQEVQPREPKEVEPQNGYLEVEPLSKEDQPLSGLRKFVELKKKAAEKVGIDFRIYEFPAEITTQKLRKEIVGIAKAEVNHGVIVELPLPAHINTRYILNAIPPEKDPDVLSEKSQGAFFARPEAKLFGVGRSVILPPAVEAVKIIFEKHGIDPKGKNCTVFGYGLLVGKPVSHWLAQQGATASIINEFTPNPERYTLNADVIISGVGKPNLITADMVKEGVVVIDFGYNTAETPPLRQTGLGVGQAQNENGNIEVKVMGDTKFDEVSKKAGWITPVPGGVGPIVVAAVLKNLVTLYKTRVK